MDLYGQEVSPKICCFPSRDLLRLEVPAWAEGGARGHRWGLGSGLGQELLKNVAPWPCGPPQLFHALCFFHPPSLAGRISVSLCELGENVAGSHCISVQSGKRTNLPKAPASHAFPSLSPTSSIMGRARQAWVQVTSLSECRDLGWVASLSESSLSSSTLQLRQ